MRRRWILLIGLLALLLPVREAAAELGSFQNTRAVGNGRWEWTIAIRADPATLRDIFCVEYSLEPTFPHPVRRVCTIGNPRIPFATRGAAWGNTRVDIRVFTRSGRILLLQHPLRLN
jgi:transcription initiation factor IIF auxiliary subunit